MSAKSAPQYDAQAGRCLACGKRVVRGYDEHEGALAVVEIWPASASAEQLHRARGGTSYVLGWRAGMTLRRRTDRDVLMRPAGAVPERVVLTHECEGGKP